MVLCTAASSFSLSRVHFREVAGEIWLSTGLSNIWANNNPRTGWNRFQRHHLLDRKITSDGGFSIQKPLFVPTKGFESPDHKDHRHSLGRFSCPVWLNYVFVGGLTNLTLGFWNSGWWLISPRWWHKSRNWALLVGYKFFIRVG